MSFLVGDEGGLTDTREQRIVHDLHEPDETHHEHGGDEVHQGDDVDICHAPTLGHRRPTRQRADVAPFRATLPIRRTSGDGRRT